jgi:tetratricopeptide (TPR) repeat protein
MPDMKTKQSLSRHIAANWARIFQPLGLLAFLGLPGVLQAHGDLHEQIEAIAARIEKDPDNAELYLKRGELHRAHREWAAAQADFDRAANRSPSLDTVDLARGLLWMDMGDWAQAEKALGNFLASHPDHAAALAAHGRVLVRMGRHKEGAVEFTRALAVKPLPELYLERARALVKDDTANLKNAVDGLNEGLAKLGHVVTLQLLALDFEVQMQDYTAALARLDAITLRSPRKEAWLARRGDLLHQAGRDPEAQVAWKAALAAIAQLPPHRRGTRAMTALESQLQASLDQQAR